MSAPSLYCMADEQPQVVQEEKPRLEVSAGALVFKRVQNRVYVVMIKDPYGKWTFPKGHVRRGESLNEAAVRECMEETGVHDLSFKRKLGTIDIWFRDRFVFKGRLIHKYIHYFLFEAPTTARVHLPRHHEGEKIQEVAWIPLADIPMRSTYKDLKDIVRRAISVIQLS